MVAPLNLEPAPSKTSDRELLQWERELLGLYLSAHPLDAYDAYFAEQTMPIAQLNKDMDNKTATVGGVILDVRAIVTKNGSKMAFVKMEDKTAEMEVIVFPNLFQEIGEKLAQDQVIKVKGKLNAKDRDGRTTDDLKIIADEIVFVTPEELENYTSTGKAMKLPKATTKNVAAAAPGEVTVTYQPVIEEPPKPAKLYVHVKDPNDHDALLKLKQTFNDYPGTHEVVLVLGTEKKSAIRLPFTIEPHDELQTLIGNLLGPDCVAVK